jgi:hypothetical protein
LSSQRKPLVHESSYRSRASTLISPPPASSSAVVSIIRGLIEPDSTFHAERRADLFRRPWGATGADGRPSARRPEPEAF